MFLRSQIGSSFHFAFFNEQNRFNFFFLPNLINFFFLFFTKPKSKSLSKSFLKSSTGLKLCFYGEPFKNPLFYFLRSQTWFNFYACNFEFSFLFFIFFCTISSRPNLYILNCSIGSKFYFVFLYEIKPVQFFIFC